PGISSIIVQLVAFTSGMWFTTDMIGGFFSVMCEVLPFKSCVDLLKCVINGSYDNFARSSIVFAVYLVIITILSVIIFNRSLKSDKK
ncbi:MAG: hypothetical protein J6R29_00500, partial [Clostridia bacterium]|nr:hypothetical protein [Clostridia bacterium]